MRPFASAFTTLGRAGFFDFGVDVGIGSELLRVSAIFSACLFCEQMKNPRSSSAERSGISYATRCCGRLPFVGSTAYRNDRSVDVRHHVVPIDLAPLMSFRGTAQVVLPIVDFIAPVPVVFVHLRTRFPFMVLFVCVIVVMISVLMILGQGGHAGQSYSQDGESKDCSYRFHDYSCGLDSNAV
jgi:hypothetical protein